MSIRIDGGVVVGWSGTGHEIIPNGSVLIEGNTIESVGADKSPAGRPGHRRQRQDRLPRFYQPACALAAQRRRLSADRCHEERLSRRQLVRVRRAVERKGRTAGAAGGGVGTEVCALQRAAKRCDNGPRSRRRPGRPRRLCRHRRSDRRAGVFQSAVSQSRYFHRRRGAALL